MDKAQLLSPRSSPTRSYDTAPNSLPSPPKALKRRWYVLGVFSLMSLSLGTCVNPYGMIANASEKAYRWTDSDIALISNWQPISFVVSIAFFSWLMDSKGLRVSCLLSAFLMLLGCVIRCISQKPPLSSWLQHIGSILTGLTSAVAFAGPSSISSTWFPVEERTTATAVAAFSNLIGVAIAVVLGPEMVHVPNTRHGNGTIINSTLLYEETKQLHYATDEFIADKDILIVRQEMANYFYIQTALSGVVFLMMLIYFPAKPPVLPSCSAGMERADYKSGIKQIITNYRFWILTFVYSATNGVFTCYAAVLDVDLKSNNIRNDQKVSGFMNFFAMMALGVIGLAIARLADALAHHVKTIMLSLCAFGTIVTLWYSSILDGMTSPDLTSLYISFILGTVCITSATPLYYEMACESTYPAAESLTSSILNLFNNIFSVIFYLILMIPGIGTRWMHWAVVGCAAVCIPILIPFKQVFPRLEMDAPGNSATESKREQRAAVKN